MDEGSRPPVPPAVRGAPRDPGDAWAEGPDGQRAWGRFGAAGLLIDDGTGRVLLQHRVEWSHFGGTWGIPGGARHEGESAVAGALRESAEEAGVPADRLRLRHTHVLDLGFWSYTTVAARVDTAFVPVVADAESIALEWVPVEDVTDLPLHPGFARAWPELAASLRTTPHVVVDEANVVGSVPDGWWRDLAGAAERFFEHVGTVADGGIPAEDLGLPFATWWPRWTIVLEGEARRAADPTARLSVVRAGGSGDDAIVDAARAATTAGERTIVVTADRELRARVEMAGASVRSPRWLRDRF